MNFEKLVDRYIKEILYTESQIKSKVKKIAKQVENDYLGKDLILVSVLKGSTYFLADLSRQIKLPLSLDFMSIASYGPTSQHTGVVKLLKDLDAPIENKDVLVVEDIIDTGLTLRYLLKTLQARNPNSLKVCTLLDKSVRRLVPLDIAYKGFDISDIFVVGYGLDFDQKFRNLPFIGILNIDELINDAYE